eukprot:scaffold178854_cov58-Attheya_sp.AAC.3
MEQRKGFQGSSSKMSRRGGQQQRREKVPCHRDRLHRLHLERFILLAFRMRSGDIIGNCP